VLSTHAKVLTEGKDWIPLAQIISLRLCLVARILPFEKMPCCHNEIERGKNVCDIRLHAPVVVIQFCAKIICGDKIE
jgi:hypothetical protein